MIYQLLDNYIDLSKVEFISQLKDVSGNKYFTYQINGKYLYTDNDEYKERENFINAWEKYQKRKAMGYQE